MNEKMGYVYDMPFDLLESVISYGYYAIFITARVDM
jgi:hypothetical protein